MNKELIQKIKTLRDSEGLNLREIGGKLGITKQKASILYNTDTEKKTFSKWSSFRLQWEKLYLKEGWTYKEIAEEYKVSSSVVYLQLKKNNVKKERKEGNNMKVYFSKKTKNVTRIKEERNNKPYCNTEEYRKNLSELNAEEVRSYNDYLREKDNNE